MKRDLLIAVDDAHLARMGEVVDRLRAAGLDIHDANEIVGTVTGSINDLEVQVESLEALDGVGAVEPQESYELPPPDSTVQ